MFTFPTNNDQRTTNPMARITHFRDLKAWQVCRELRNRVRLLVRSWPPEERYRLTDQIIRSSRSATANIAEGYGRFYERENIRFCRIARGSLYETQDHMITARDEELITDALFEEHFALVERAVMLVNGYLKYLEGMRDKSGSAVSEPGPVYERAEEGVTAPSSPDSPLDADL